MQRCQVQMEGGKREKGTTERAAEFTGELYGHTSAPGYELLPHVEAPADGEQAQEGKTDGLAHVSTGPDLVLPWGEAAGHAGLGVEVEGGEAASVIAHWVTEGCKTHFLCSHYFTVHDGRSYQINTGHLAHCEAGRLSSFCN
ncbi:unnamed protein product [Menidia menidia]|uniref:(Atlantic silverside) hypothetical protein n=1 Tax=Menidia menidia TaxID=238744 RepID=A0A8S4ADN4_9TELE|nr:unnamed protein product [Menidia menidia]